MTVPTTGPEPVGACKHCTDPVDTGETCAFCSSYTPPESPAQRLDVAVNRIDLLRHDGNEILQALPADAPLMSVVDIVTAIGHLRRASALLDKAGDALDTAAVTR